MADISYKITPDNYSVDNSITVKTGDNIQITITNNTFDFEFAGLKDDSVEINGCSYTRHGVILPFSRTGYLYSLSGIPSIPGEYVLTKYELDLNGNYIQGGNLTIIVESDVVRLKTKINNEWADSSPMVKINGSWKNLISAFAKINNTWKQHK